MNEWLHEHDGSKVPPLRGESEEPRVYNPWGVMVALLVAATLVMVMVGHFIVNVLEFVL